MAIAVYFAPASMSSKQYDECLKRLEKAGAGKPKGRQYHSCFGPATKIEVFDVWESQADFDKFGETLMPILKQMGVDPGPPQIAQVYNIIKG